MSGREGRGGAEYERGRVPIDVRVVDKIMWTCFRLIVSACWVFCVQE